MSDYQLSANVSDALDRPALVQVGVESGSVRVLVPAAGQGFTASPSQVMDLIAALHTAGWAAKMQREGGQA